MTRSFPTIDELYSRAAAAGDTAAARMLADRDNAAREAAATTAQAVVTAALQPVMDTLANTGNLIQQMGIGVAAAVAATRADMATPEELAGLTPPAEEPAATAASEGEQPPDQPGEDDPEAARAAEEDLPEDAQPVDPGTGAPVGEPPAEPDDEQ